MGRAGNFVTQLTGYKAFIPEPLPPNPSIEQDEEMIHLLTNASMAIGRLSGLSYTVPDPDLFVYLYVRKEALLSSQIEGTQCSLEDILDPIAEPSTRALPLDIEEVSNYVRTMNEGLARLESLPVSTRLIREMHATLMAGVRGANKTPGEFRKSQNWIGRPGATLTTAEFVPPPPDVVARLMSELEKFIHAEDRIPPLIKAALIHAHFETIHPFLDGNGRLGRLLITYLLCTWKVLEKPLLYLSFYFKTHRSEYYARLMDVRQHGSWEAWVKFFLRGVQESAEMATAAAIDIHQLHTADRRRLHEASPTKAASAIFEFFCHNPILGAPDIAHRLGMSKPTVQRGLDALGNFGIVKEISGRQRDRRYAYSQYLEILTRDTVSKIG